MASNGRLRLAYFGSPDDAVPPLRELAGAGHEIVLVVTRPDRRRSRGPEPLPSPVKRAAVELGLPVATPARAIDVLDDLRATGAQVGVVVAYGQLLPVALLEAPPYGFVNLHFSLLPRWRGAAPVERAILAGDAETGVCLMRVEESLDSGPVHASARLTIGPDETAGELRARLVEAGTTLLLEHLPHVPSSDPEPQQGEATYASKLTVDEFRLDPDRPAQALARLVRAGNPRPGTWFVIGGRRVKIWSAHAEEGTGHPGEVDASGRLGCTAGLLVLDEVQAEGRRRTSGAAWRAGLRGAALVEPPGAR